MVEVHFIGTSDAFGAGGRRQSAVVIRDPHGALLLDCGATTNTGLAAEGISRDEIDAVVISHFHGDHFGGVPLLLLAALYEDHRTRPLQIAGPPEIEKWVHELAESMGCSNRGPQRSFPIVFTELEAGLPFEVGPATVTSFEVRHNPESCPHGVHLALDQCSVVYSGDTGWFDALPDHVSGADLFICECTYCKADFEMHLSFEQISERESQFDCERIVLTHLGSEMTSLRGKLDFETADDGMKIKL